MSAWLIYAIGFVAQLLFSGRSIIQWLVSEKNKKVLTPTIFWKMSLLASFLLFVYGYLRSDFAIMLGQALTYFIYIRNLQLQNQWERLHKVFRIFLYIFPVIIVVFAYNNQVYDLERLLSEETISTWLLLLGIVGQVVFTLRFIYQWIYSERRKESSLPLGFWLLSFAGSLLILIYAVYRMDPVLLAGHIFGIIMYSRNIYLLKKENKYD